MDLGLLKRLTTKNGFWPIMACLAMIALFGMVGVLLKTANDDERSRQAEKPQWTAQTENFDGFVFRHADCSLIAGEGTIIHLEKIEQDYPRIVVRVTTPKKEQLIIIYTKDCNPITAIN